MAGKRGIAGARLLARRAKGTKGGNAAHADAWDRFAPDALALWRDGYLDQLAARNYSEGTIAGRRDSIKVFLNWCAERDLSRASQITRPILINAGSGNTPKPMASDLAGAPSGSVCPRSKTGSNG